MLVRTRDADRRLAKPHWRAWRVALDPCHSPGSNNPWATAYFSARPSLTFSGVLGGVGLANRRKARSRTPISPRLIQALVMGQASMAPPTATFHRFSAARSIVSSISSGYQDLGEVCNANEPRTGEFRGRMPPVLHAHVDSGARSLHALEHMTREPDWGLIHGAARRAGSRDPDSG